jgi:hypothetical protein
MHRIDSLDWQRGLLAFAIMAYHLTSWELHALDASTLLGRLGIYGVKRWSRPKRMIRPNSMRAAAGGAKSRMYRLSWLRWAKWPPTAKGHAALNRRITRQNL